MKRTVLVRLCLIVVAGLIVITAVMNFVVRRTAHAKLTERHGIRRGEPAPPNGQIALFSNRDTGELTLLGSDEGGKGMPRIITREMLIEMEGGSIYDQQSGGGGVILYGNYFENILLFVLGPTKATPLIVRWGV